MRFSDLFEPRLGYASQERFHWGPEVQTDFCCEYCGNTPTTLVAPMTAYHYDAPARAVGLTQELRLLSLDCIGFQSFARMAEIEEERVAVDAELEMGNPNKWRYLCPECREFDREYWQGMWDEYYRMVL